LQLAKFSGVTAVPGPLTVGDGNGPADYDQVVLMAHNQIADDAEIYINDSGLLDVNGWIESLGPISFNGGRLDSGGFFLHLLGDVTTLTNANASAYIDGRFSLSGSGVFNTQVGGVTAGLHIRAQIIGDAGHPLLKKGLGTLRLSHTNNLYDGLTLVEEGYLWLTKGVPGSIVSGTIVSNRATLTLSHNTVIGNESLVLPGTGAGNTRAALTSFFGTNWWGGSMTLSGHAAIRVDNPTDLFTVHGAITGPYGLTKTGPGTLELSGDVANGYSGTTAVLDGVLALDKVPGAAAIPHALSIGYPGTNTAEVRLLGPNQVHNLAPVSLTTNGLFNLNNKAETVGSLAGEGQVNLGFASLTAGGNNTDTTFSGSMGGVIFAGFTKEGSGRMALTGTNTYPGKTIVNGGNLGINGQQSGPVAVNGGGSLNGSGRMGAITVTNGVLSPGNEDAFGPGLARLNSGSVALNESSGFRVGLAGTHAGSNYCQLNVAGAVNLGNAGLNVELSFASAVSNQFMIVMNDGNDAVVGTFKGLPEGATTNVNGAQFHITYAGGTGNDVVLTQLTVAPPPQLGSITRLNNGQIQIAGTGVPGLLYNIEATSDLGTPNWVHLGATLALPPMGALEFIDIDAANLPQRFYRFVLP
ncbi:MAG TPA: autotransporter-associated beta strand repeat-containing protein, partial [Verrucomicrobiae bacterium]|nr:autotransporter-associated beta strand repeat-containing protein [Verrucomicrobiae bacterium]